MSSQEIMPKEKLTWNMTSLLIIIVAAFAVYGPSLGHDFLLNWDDPRYVVKNEAIRALNWANLKTIFTTFYVGNYAPLHILSYIPDYLIAGGKPWGFIAGNILWHATASFLLNLILLRFNFSRYGALFASLVFLFHPVQVESVVWISQRKNALAMFFYLLSMFMYVRWYRAPGRGGAAAYSASLAAFAAALLAKSVTVILPVTLIIHDLCYAGERRRGRLLLDKLPYLLVALAMGCLAMLTQSAEYGGGGRTGYHGGSPLATLFTMLPVYAAYVRMIFWPAGLSAVYTPVIKGSMDAEVALAALLMVFAAAVMLWVLRRNRPLFFWAAAIPVGLLPVSQIVPLVTLMNDRYLYFPMLGVAACCGYLLDRFVQLNSGKWRTPALVAALALTLVLAVLSLYRSRAWQNSDTLWRDATSKQPDNAVAWHITGELREKEGRFAEAIVAEERARELCRGVECRLVIRKLAELYLRENQNERAESSISELLRMFPDAADGHALYGHLSYQKGNLEQAEKSYLRALQIDPAMVSALSALGNVYLATGRPALAMEKYRTSATLAQPTAELVYSMACAASLMGDVRLALELLDEALRLGYNKPDLIMLNPELNAIKGGKEFAVLMQRHFPGIIR